jgi:hypothetical protein
MTDCSRIDASRLEGVRLSPDGSRLILLLCDATGQKVSLSLPTNFLNAVLSALPRPLETGTVHAVDSWNVGLAENGNDVILTLNTPEGAAMSFNVKPWQVQGMATVATYGTTRETSSRSIH